MNLFFRDQSLNQSINWAELLVDVKNSKKLFTYCKSKDFYFIFLQIVNSLINDLEIVLLDEDFSDFEITRLIGDIELLNKTVDLNFPVEVNTPKELINKARETGSKWKLTIYTSGTQGTPKKITHDFKSITRNCRISEKHVNDIWGFAYNPTHIAGVQVFLQAFLNGNAMIRLFNLSVTVIKEEISQMEITHVSATPTFFRLFINEFDKFNSVKQVTSGGEKLTKELVEKLNDVFPNAKISNIYASTEAGTLFHSKNDVFELEASMEKLVRIENDELVIHGSLIKSKEILIKNWFYTNDVVEVINSKPLKFRFITRKSSYFNVGGYVVNPNEVEEIILSLGYFKEVLVYPKKNSVLGNIICCDVVINDAKITEFVIKNQLRMILQSYKIPRIFRFVDSIQKTRTGKIKR